MTDTVRLYNVFRRLYSDVSPALSAPFLSSPTVAYCWLQEDALTAVAAQSGPQPVTAVLVRNH